MNKSDSPFAIKCTSCGAPAAFDIFTQSYRCGFCNNSDSVRVVKESFELKKRDVFERIRLESRDYPAVKYSCPSCGSDIMVEKGHAQAVCDYCGSKLIRKAFTEDENIPLGIIPFKLTHEEASDILLELCKEKRGRREAAEVENCIADMKGAYLPYQFVAGNVECKLEQDNSGRKYQCMEEIKGRPVNTVAELDNGLLDAIEPFSPEEMREFEYGYVAGHKVRLQDVNEYVLINRAREEIAAEYKKAFSVKFGTGGVKADPQLGNMLSSMVLLPVYFIKKGNKTIAAVNGQTGRAAINTDVWKTDFSWIIESLAIILLVFLFIYYLMKPDIFTPLFAAFITALFIFVTLGNDRRPERTHELLLNEIISAERENGVLRFEKQKKTKRDSLKSTGAVLFEYLKGKKIPVDIRFYTPARVVLFTILLLIPAAAPAVFAVVFRLISVLLGYRPFADALMGMQFGYGAAWYCIALPVTIIAWGKVIRRLVYDYPVIRTIRPDGGLGSFEESSRTSTAALMVRVIKEVFLIVLFPPLLIAVLFLVLGSAAAIAF